MGRLSRPTLACVAVCAAVIGVAVADYAHVQSKVPEIPAPRCPVEDQACQSQRNAELFARTREISHLEDQFGSRSWLYSSAIVALATLATGLSLRGRRRQQWPRLFTNLGIVAVWAGIAATAAVVIGDSQTLTVRAAALYAPAVVMLAAALIGTLIGRSEGWERDPGVVSDVRDGAAAVGKRALDVGTGGTMRQAQMDKLARWLVTACLTLTGVTLVLGIVFITGQPECSTESANSPDWTDTVASISAFTAIAAIAAGVGALLLRRWVPALVTLLANPVIGVAMLLSTCALLD